MQLREEPMKAGHLLGMPIVDLNLGEQVDSVRDVIFDRRASAVLGLEVQQGSWPRKKTWVIPFSVVYSVGEDAVMVAGSQSAGTPEEQAGLKEAMQGGAGVVGLTLTAPDGTDLGRIQDVAFDIYTGRVAGYQVSGGPQEFVRVAGGVEVDKKLARITGSPRPRPQAAPQPAEAIAGAPESEAEQQQQPSAQQAPKKPKQSPPTQSPPTQATEPSQPLLAQFQPIEPIEQQKQPTAKSVPLMVADQQEPVVKVKLPAQVSAPQQNEPASAQAPQQKVRARLKAVVQRDREQTGGETGGSSGRARPISPSPAQAQVTNPPSTTPPSSQTKTAVVAAPPPPVSAPPAATAPKPTAEARAEGDAVERAKHWLEGSLGAMAEKLEAAERELAASSQLSAQPTSQSVTQPTAKAAVKVAEPEGEGSARDPSALLKQALGWPVVQDIRADSGQLILAAGETVTREALAQAHQAGKLRELLAAVRRAEASKQELSQ